MPLRVFLKVLLNSKQENACAEVNSLALAVAAVMKTKQSENNNDRDTMNDGDSKVETTVYRDTPHKLAKRRASHFDSDSSSSSEDDIDDNRRNSRTPPISNRHMRMHRMRQRRSLMYT